MGTLTYVLQVFIVKRGARRYYVRRRWWNPKPPSARERAKAHRQMGESALKSELPRDTTVLSLTKCSNGLLA